MTVHLREVAPNSAPGALYLRICTASGRLLVEHPLDDLDRAPVMAEDDGEMVRSWLERHSDDKVYNYVYDGDSGECVTTVIVDGPESA